MKNILIATGIFPPAIGGPALYSQGMAEEFSRFGIGVSVVTYGDAFLKSGKYEVIAVSGQWFYGLRHLIYFLKLLRSAKKADAIIAFDSLGAGFPAALVGKLSGKRVVIRIGGDFLWEKYIESGREGVTLTEFYDNGLQKNFYFLLRLIKFTLQSADKVAFTTEFQRNLFIRAYGLSPNKCEIVGIVFEKEPGESAYRHSGRKTILWAGRFIRLKNLEFLLKVFKRLLVNDGDLMLRLVGEGPERRAIAAAVKAEGLVDKVKITGSMDERSLSEEIGKAYFCILPSLSDISPNFALKCLGLNKPIVLTQETGIRKDFPGLMYADPKKEESFYLAALRLLDDNSYDNYLKSISGIRYHKTWKHLAGEYLKLAEM